MMSCVEALQRLDGAHPRAIGAGKTVLGTTTKRLLELLGGLRHIGLESVLARVRSLFELRLLPVDHVLARALGHLVLIQLSLVCILTILLQPQIGGPLSVRATTRLQIPRVTAERFLGSVERLLIAVDARLLAVGDHLVQVDHRLLSIELALPASLTLRAIGAHAGTSWRMAPGRPT
jgi:hypothetical protein